MTISAPGVSIGKLLRTAKPKSVRKHLPLSAVNLIERMSAGLLETEEANSIAVAIIDPIGTIQNESKRS